MNSIRKWVASNEKLLTHFAAGIALVLFLFEISSIPTFMSFIVDDFRYFGEDRIIHEILFILYHLIVLLGVPAILALPIGLYVKQDIFVYIFIFIHLLERVFPIFFGAFGVMEIFLIALYLLFFFACLFKNEKSIYAGLAASTLYLIVCIFNWVYHGISLYFLSGLYSLCYLALPFVVGLIYSVRKAKARSAHVPKGNQNDNLHSNIEKIANLSELLAGGIITQEEFDTKKKQLLGL